MSGASTPVTMFAASVVAKRGAEHQIAYIGLQLPRKGADGKPIAGKAKPSGNKGYIPAEIFEKTKIISKGTLWFDTGLLMPSRATGNVEKFRTIFMSWDNPMTSAGMGLILRGTADPTNVNDKRNTYVGTACRFEILLANLGALGEAIGYIDRDFADGINTMNGEWNWQDGKTEYNALVTTTITKTIEGVEQTEDVEPRVSFMALVGETWSQTSFPSQFRGRAKTVIYDYTKPYEHKDPKTGKTTTKYEPYMVEDLEGAKQPVDATNLHTVLSRGHRVRRMELYIDKVTHSDKGNNSPHPIAHSIVVEPISQEIDIVEDDDNTAQPDDDLVAAVDGEDADAIVEDNGADDDDSNAGNIASNAGTSAAAAAAVATPPKPATPPVATPAPAPAQKAPVVAKTVAPASQKTTVNVAAAPAKFAAATKPAAKKAAAKTVDPSDL